MPRLVPSDDLAVSPTKLVGAGVASFLSLGGEEGVDGVLGFVAAGGVWGEGAGDGVCVNAAVSGITMTIPAVPVIRTTRPIGISTSLSL